MQDCSNCSNVVVSGQDHFCKINNSVYPISNYPDDGASCSTWNQGHTQKVTKEHSRDPLLSWINRFNKGKEKDESHNVPVIDEKEQKIIEAFNNNAKDLGIEIPKATPSPVHQTYQTRTITQPETTLDGEVNVKNALGWIVAAILGGIIIGLWLLGLL
jgi:hypothetical protein